MQIEMEPLYYYLTVCVSLYLCILIYIFFEKDNVAEKVKVKEVDEFVDDEEFVDEELRERLSEMETKLEKKAKLLEQMNHIEKMSDFIEKEKEKGLLSLRLAVLENVTYQFNLSDFNNYCRGVYDSVKEQSKCKSRTHIMKKIGKMWREMPDFEKIKYK